MVLWFFHTDVTCSLLHMEEKNAFYYHMQYRLFILIASWRFSFPRQLQKPYDPLQMGSFPSTLKYLIYFKDFRNSGCRGLHSKSSHRRLLEIVLWVYKCKRGVGKENVKYTSCSILGVKGVFPSCKYGPQLNFSVQLKLVLFLILKFMVCKERTEVDCAAQKTVEFSYPQEYLIQIRFVTIFPSRVYLRWLNIKISCWEYTGTNTHTKRKTNLNVKNFFFTNLGQLVPHANGLFIVNMDFCFLTVRTLFKKNNVSWSQAKRHLFHFQSRVV